MNTTVPVAHTNTTDGGEANTLLSNNVETPSHVPVKSKPTNEQTESLKTNITLNLVFTLSQPNPFLQIQTDVKNLHKPRAHKNVQWITQVWKKQNITQSCRLHHKTRKSMTTHYHAAKWTPMSESTSTAPCPLWMNSQKACTGPIITLLPAHSHHVQLNGKYNELINVAQIITNIIKYNQARHQSAAFNIINLTDEDMRCFAPSTLENNQIKNFTVVESFNGNHSNLDNNNDNNTTHGPQPRKLIWCMQKVIHMMPNLHNRRMTCMMKSHHPTMT